MTLELSDASLLADLLNHRFIEAAAHLQHLLAQEVQLQRGLQEFSGLYSTRAVLFPHQIAAAHKVLNECPRGALLADEVGLGKTIEAGLVLKELMLRGQAKQVLIVAPAHLLTQWQAELQEKYALESTVLDSELRQLRSKQGDPLWQEGITLVSMGLVPRLQGQALSELKKHPWDLLVVDEAHRIRGQRSKTHDVLRQLKRKRTLLLTATPIQTGLPDLINLLALIDPFVLSDQETRNLQSGLEDSLDSIKTKLQSVMVRNRRQDVQLVGLKLPPRQAQSLHFDLPEPEQVVRQAVHTYTRDIYERSGKKGSFDILALERLAASHPYALEQGLRKRLDRAKGKNTVVVENEDGDIESLPEPQEAQTLQTLIHQVSKVSEARKAFELGHFLRELFLSEPDEKVIVYSEFLDTLEALERYLTGEGYKVFRFDGTLNGKTRREALAHFWAEGQILLMSEAGSEGQNLQKAHIVVNFDLPWNPMRLEQRIGRVHRIGQTRPVQIFNLVAGGTIEERLIEILQKRINLFEDVIGDLDVIVGELEQKQFEVKLLELGFAEGPQEQAVFQETDQQIQKIAEDYRKAESLDRRTFENFDLSLRDRYLELDRKQKEGLDHLPLRRFLRSVKEARGLTFNPDDQIFSVLGYPALTLNPQVAADQGADLLHPFHPLVVDLLKQSAVDTPVSRLLVQLSESGMVYPPEMLGKRGLMFSLKATWTGDASDQVLLHVFVDSLGRVRGDLSDHFLRAKWTQAHHLTTPDHASMLQVWEHLQEALPALLKSHHEGLLQSARSQFEILARNIEKYFSEQLERHEQNLYLAGKEVLRARLQLHHTESPELRDEHRKDLQHKEQRYFDLLRELPDKMQALTNERDRKVQEERSRLCLDLEVQLVGIALVEWE